MEDIIDLIATDSKPSDISDAIKQNLFLKSIERIDALKPEVADLLFNNNDEVEESE